LITEIRDMEMAEGARVSPDALDELTDEELLERFTSQREEAAFTALVRRHAALVLGVCRRVLHHAQDTEDAFQAVFCVLARKAGAIRRRSAVAGWLYAVAYRIACRARAARGRRPVTQSNFPDLPAAPESSEWVWRELQPILDQEVNRLPDKYRQLFVLCYLEGKTNEQAAAQLGCPVGTVRSRLARARDRLRARLTRRGLTLSAGGLAAALGAAAAQGAVPPALIGAGVQSGLAFALDPSAAGSAVSAGARALADEFLKALLRARLTIPIGLVSALAVVVAVVCVLWVRSRGAGAVNTPAPAARVAATPQTEREKLQGSWQVVGMEMAGRQVEAQANQGFQGYGFRFTDSRWTLSVPGGPPMAPMPFVLDPSQEPKAIDLTMFPGKTVLAIYQVDGDSLTLCLDWDPAGTGGKRPTTFRTQPDALNVTLFVLRREPARPGSP
jgi:RNA polymerase sigma factor (sigma-70 family)